jgi:hypothetical protein
MGHYNGYLILVQCKDLSKSISVKDVREFEAAVLNYPKKSTLCVFVSNRTNSRNFNNGFSPEAIDWAKNSKSDMVLTNIFNLQKDLRDHKFKYPTEEEEIEEMKEGISDLNNKFEKFDEKFNEKFKEFEKKNIILIIIIILLIIIIIFK